MLELPHEAQELLSAEKTPTVSIAMPAYELLRDAWVTLPVDVPMMEHYVGVGVSKLDEYMLKSRKSRIFALSMSIVTFPASFVLVAHVLLQLSTP